MNLILAIIARHFHRRDDGRRLRDDGRCACWQREYENPTLHGRLLHGDALVFVLCVEGAEVRGIHPDGDDDAYTDETEGQREADRDFFHLFRIRDSNPGLR